MTTRKTNDVRHVQHTSTQPEWHDVFEWDIDFLLWEELKCSAHFRTEFLRKAFGEAPPEGCWDVRHSEKRANGESDITLQCATANGEVYGYFIENKIGAPFGKNQLKRYMESGEERKSRVEKPWQKWTDFKIIVTAPKDYSVFLESPLISKVDYETIASLIQGSVEHSEERKQHKVSHLYAAINKLNRGKVSDDAATSFMRAYRKCAFSEPYSLNVNDQPGWAKGGAWAYFSLDGLPRGIKVIHKIPEGFISLEFTKKLYPKELVGKVFETLGCGSAARIREVKASWIVEPLELPRIPWGPPTFNSPTEKVVRECLDGIASVLRTFREKWISSGKLLMERTDEP